MTLRIYMHFIRGIAEIDAFQLLPLHKYNYFMHRSFLLGIFGGIITF